MRRQNIIILLFSITIVVIIWIGFNTYHAFVSSKITSTLTGEITPINPSFDMNVIQALKQREQVTPLYEMSESSTASPDISTTPSVPTLTPAPTVKTVTASTSAQTSL